MTCSKTQTNTQCYNHTGLNCVFLVAQNYFHKALSGCECYYQPSRDPFREFLSSRWQVHNIVAAAPLQTERETSAVHCDSAFNISATLHPAGEGFFFFCYIKFLICGHQGLPVFSCHNCDRQTNRLKVAIVHREAKYKKGVFYEQFERALYYCFFLANAEAQVLPLAKALEHGHFQGLWLIT